MTTRGRTRKGADRPIVAAVLQIAAGVAVLAIILAVRSLSGLAISFSSVRVQGDVSFGVQAHVSVSGWGLWCRFVGGVDKVRSVFEPVGGAVDGDDLAVVQETVQDGGGAGLVTGRAADA